MEHKLSAHPVNICRFLRLCSMSFLRQELQFPPVAFQDFQTVPTLFHKDPFIHTDRTCRRSIPGRIPHPQNICTLIDHPCRLIFIIDSQFSPWDENPQSLCSALESAGRSFQILSVPDTGVLSCLYARLYFPDSMGTDRSGRLPFPPCLQYF